MLRQRAAAVTDHSSGRVSRKIKALMAVIDEACGLLEGRRYKAELPFEVLQQLPAVLAGHQVGSSQLGHSCHCMLVGGTAPHAVCLGCLYQQEGYTLHPDTALATMKPPAIAMHT
jgi:hypothetical protein